VGEAIKEALKSDTGIKRADLFITTKVWINDVEDVEAACKRSLSKLGLDYIDLYLVHWPIAVRDYEENGETKYEKINLPMHKVWPQMEDLV